jgi:hypothetical protein
MDQDIVNILCLYSSFSKSCSDFIKQLRENNLDFVNLLQVDTQHARKIASTNVQKVPALLLEYSDGRVELFEGDRCFSWLYEIINNKRNAESARRQEMEQEKIRKQMQELEMQKRMIEKQKMEMMKLEMEEMKKKNELEAQKENKTTSINEVISESQTKESVKFEEPNSVVGERTETKPSASSKKTQDLLTRARELEKGRELELPNKKPPL